MVRCDATGLSPNSARSLNSNADAIHCLVLISHAKAPASAQNKGGRNVLETR